MGRANLAKAMVARDALAVTSHCYEVDRTAGCVTMANKQALVYLFYPEPKELGVLKLAECQTFNTVWYFSLFFSRKSFAFSSFSFFFSQRFFGFVLLVTGTEISAISKNNLLLGQEAQ